jgi:predicted DsbA family dithiol-disulfide isomerase
LTELDSRCLSDTKFANAIKADMTAAMSANMEGTPTFILGRISGSQLMGTAIVGPFPTETFVQLIDEQLSLQPNRYNLLG